MIVIRHLAPKIVKDSDGVPVHKATIVSSSKFDALCCLLSYRDHKSNATKLKDLHFGVQSTRIRVLLVGNELSVSCLAKKLKKSACPKDQPSFRRTGNFGFFFSITRSCVLSLAFSARRSSVCASRVIGIESYIPRCINTYNKITYEFLHKFLEFFTKRGDVPFLSINAAPGPFSRRSSTFHSILCVVLSFPKSSILYRHSDSHYST